ncbi:hypothetical protein V8C37DRAFT_418393 [Trichoderma ceciliae]
MTTFHQSPHPSLATMGTREDAAALKKILQTPYDSVYKLSPDGRTYLEPPLLRGTPVKPKQAPEAEKKRETRVRTSLDPTNKVLQKALKRYSDNSSKFIKIRKFFGENSQYHPNQIIGKGYLPPGGLCQKEPMYRLACKISDLQHLHRIGELAMDPFDFIRWRIMKKAASLLQKPGDNPKEFLRTIIYKLCDDSQDAGAKVYQDSVMRQAVLLSAWQRNQLGSYGPKRKNRNQVAARPRPLPYKQIVSPQATRLLSGDVDNLPEHSLAPVGRIGRHVHPIATPPIYAGVNAFRAMQQQQHIQRRLNGN